MGGKSKKAVTVGYRYYLGLHFGFCHGPIDALERIEVGDRAAWSGSQTVSGQIYVNSPGLFGGEEKEGGIQGTTDVMMGESSQGINSYLQSKQGNPQPGYRGFFGLVFRGGLISCNNPYVKGWAARVRRVLKGWHNDQVWYSSKAQIQVASGIIGANPAHIIYECLTDPTWGMGYPRTLIDNESFEDAADAFYSEGLGLCIAWGQQDSLSNFIQVVLDHAGAVLSQDAGGGYFKLRALRGDYVPANLEEFSDQNGKIVSLEKIERSTYTENVNEIVVKFVDASTGRQSSIYAQNLASVQAQGAVVSQTRQYLGIPTSAIASRIAMRDLKASTSGLARITFVSNRSAYALVPGDVIKFVWSPAGIQSMSLRITRIDYGPLTSGLIRVEGIEDVFGLPATTYAGVPPVGWSPPNFTATAPSSTMVMEATYKDLYDQFGSADIGAVDPLAGYLIAAASRPASGVSFNYRLQTRSGSSAYTDRTLGDWAPTATLAAGITKSDTSITVENAYDLESIELNSTALLGAGTTAEIIQITAINLSTNTFTIKRGCIDTVPTAWPSGTRFTSYDFHGLSDDVEYVDGETVSARFLTRTSTDQLAEASAPVSTMTMDQRQLRPYPPAQIRFNSQIYPTRVDNSLVVSWVHRDRITQADQVLGQADATVGPEPGTTYRVRGFNAATNAALFDATTSSNTYTHTPSTTTQIRVDLRSVRAGLDSYQMHQHELLCVVNSIGTLARITQRATSSAQATVSSDGVPVVSQWDPSMISEQLSHWFDAESAVSIIDEGGVVSEWRDRSGNNRHAVMNPTLSYYNINLRPSYSQTAMNGRPALSFSNDNLEAPAVTLSSLCIAFAFRRTSSGCIFQIREPTNVIVIDDGARGGFGTRLRNSGGSIAEGPTATQDTAQHVSVFTFAAGTLTLFIDGTSRSTLTVAGGYSPMTRFLIGGNNDQNFGGQIAEIVMLNTSSDQPTRERLEGYLAWKWGTVDLLPAGHPYKTAPPTA